MNTIAMTDLNLFTSNRLEILSRQMADELRQHPLSSPLAGETVVVQSTGMKRWLSLELARETGICANTRFVFPNVLLQSILAAVFPEEFPGDLLDVNTMTWKLMPLLANIARNGTFAAPAAYLGDGDERKRYQLAARLADTFDQYLIFRPEIIFDWEANRINNDDRDADWQAYLWRQLADADGGAAQQPHRAAWWRKFIDLAESGGLAAGCLPERISVFGISTLPLFHVRFLHALSRHTIVNLYIMNPCRQYWADILSETEISRLEEKGVRENIALENLYLDTGNPLLASMGTVGRDFLSLLHDIDCEEISWFEAPGRETLLSGIQTDILDLTGPDPASGIAEDTSQSTTGAATESSAPSVSDRSLCISVCHSPMREVEVLHDALLDMFEADSHLAPEDILVMAPDIETYAPYIEAVFSARHPGAAVIPCTVADRSPRSASPVIAAFLNFFTLFNSRFEAADIVAALEPVFIRRRFDLTEGDLTRISRWIDKAGVRWGIDAAFKAALEMPDFAENTWQFGLDRLLLGWALPEEKGRLFAGILPCDDLEGGQVTVLKDFLRFWENLVEFKEQFDRPQTLDKWQNCLLALADVFFVVDDETEADIQLIRQLAARLGGIRETADFDELVGREVIRLYLEAGLNGVDSGGAFISGGVTFCSLLPMRSIPFDVVCLLGMNSDDYPRRVTPPGFDLIARHPRRSDRSRRNDDRYLFLESLLSARKRFYISYAGYDIKDNALRPPSPLVSELIDYVRTRCGLPEDDPTLSGIIRHHRLQPFNPEYFDPDSDLFSYFQDYFHAAQSLLTPTEAPRIFDDGTIVPPEALIKKGLPEISPTIALDALAMFFANPARFFCNHCLDIRLEDASEQLESDEPFAVYGLAQYAINQRLVEGQLAGQSSEELYAAIRAAGMLPHGEPGRCAFEALHQQANVFMEKVRTHIQNQAPVSVNIDLDLDTCRLVGRIDDMYPFGWFRYRYANVRPLDRLAAWLRYLSLGAAGQGGNGCWAGKDQWFGFTPVENSRDILITLADTYFTGLTRPLHFFPKAADDYIATMRKKGNRDTAVNAAVKTWAGGPWHPLAEGDDPYYHLCFGQTMPIDDDFEALAETVFGPLIDHLEILT